MDIDVQRRSWNNKPMQRITAADNDFLVLRRYIVVVLRRWWLLLLIVALAVAWANVLSRQQAPVYQATTSLVVGVSVQAVDLSAGDFVISQQLALVYADIARRQPVLQAVIDSLELDMSWQELKSQVRVDLNEDIRLLEIIAEGPSPEMAQAIADEVAQQLLLLSPATPDNQGAGEDQSFVRQRLDTLRGRIEDGQEEVDALQAAVITAQSADEINALQDEINILQGFINDWESNYAQLLALANRDRSIYDLAIIEPAQALPYPVRPNIRLNMLIAGVLSTALALGIIFVSEYRDDTFKTAEDITEALNLTLLGTVANIRGRNYHEKLITKHDPFSRVSESYRIIRSNIQFASVDDVCKTIMVTSATAGEGKSTLVANMAIAIAQASYATIIVDADLRRPTQHKLFGTFSDFGLTNLLRSPKEDIEDYLIQTPVANLRLLPSGVLPPNPSELLGSQRMSQIIDCLTQLADIVVFDSVSAISVADAAILSSRVDGVVFLIQAGRTRRTLATQAVLNLERAGARMLGAVLNRAPS